VIGQKIMRGGINSKMNRQLATNSLVKYDTPILVSTGKKNKKGLNPIQDRAQKEIEDTLNKILPPREFEENGQLWVQYVSRTPATRVDVLKLTDLLEKRLVSMKARSTGICPIREELFAQLFDEIIRQVTLNCNVRGQLLLRVRNEIRMTNNTYKKLYESAIAFGMRENLHGEQFRDDSNSETKNLCKDINNLEKEIENLEHTIERVQEQEKTDRENAMARHDQLVREMKTKNQSLKDEIEEVLANPK